MNQEPKKKEPKPWSARSAEWKAIAIWGADKPEQLKRTAKFIFEKAQKQHGNKRQLNKKECERMFDFLCKNSGLEPPSRKMLNAMWKRMDKNDDGAVSLEEWTSFLADTIAKASEATSALEFALIEIFKDIDKDNSGTIDRKELKAKMGADEEIQDLLSLNGISDGSEDFDSAFGTLSAAGGEFDRKISLDEFLHVLR